MNIFARTNTVLSRFPPLVIYAIGAADATILVAIGFFVSKISH